MPAWLAHSPSPAPTSCSIKIGFMYEHYAHFTHTETQRRGVTCRIVRSVPEGRAFDLSHAAGV